MSNFEETLRSNRLETRLTPPPLGLQLADGISLIFFDKSLPYHKKRVQRSPREFHFEIYLFFKYRIWTQVSFSNIPNLSYRYFQAVLSSGILMSDGLLK